MNGLFLMIASALLGSADDNIPVQSIGAMPEDKVMERMECPAGTVEWTAWRNAHPAPFWLFGEERRFAVRNNIIPAHWLSDGSNAAQRFCGSAQPGEFYPFQVCVVSEKERSLRWEAKTELPVTFATPQECTVAAGGVKPIWVMVDIPKDAAGKTFKGSVEVEDATTHESASLSFAIAVAGEVLQDGGVSDAWRLSRLKWLNSEIGREDTVTKPYTPVTVIAGARCIKILGRELVLNENGLPAIISSHFSGSNTRIERDSFNILAKAFIFREGNTFDKESHLKFTEQTPTHAAWRSETLLANGVKRITEGRLDFTGTGAFRIWHEGGRIKNVQLEIKLPADVARYMEGLGRNGGHFANCKLEHRWDEKLNRDAVWMGKVNGGIAVRFKGKNYRPPLVNAYYAWRPLAMPESWAAGNGTIKIEKNNKRATILASASGAPEDAEWNFDLFITPFHTLDMKTHLGERYWQLSQRSKAFDAQKISGSGANIVTMHHNTLWNPYINYPYNDDGGPLLKQAVDAAHKAGLKLKVYYTTRELTQNMPEFFALKSLDGEILLKRDENVPGWPVTNRNGPHPWLREHVGMDVVPAWRENVRFDAYPNKLDLAVLTTPDGRWDNFYLEGLDLLVKKYGIDGLYIDDTALTGEAMQRARRILDRDGKHRLVDNHSWRHASPLAGKGSSNLVFIDLYPYFDLLWRGEGFAYDAPPGFWLIERSGAQFGIAGEMLGKGHPFKGLVFGMTDRLGWGGNPQGIWTFFDKAKMGEMEFIGWWDDDCPIKVAGSEHVKLSVWKGKGRCVFVVANFSKDARTVDISFDFARLGLVGTSIEWRQPDIYNVQNSGNAPKTWQNLSVPGNGGFVFEAATEF